MVFDRSLLLYMKIRVFLCYGCSITIMLTQGHGRKGIILIARYQGAQGTNPGSVEGHSVKTTDIVKIPIWGDTKLYNRERAYRLG